MRRRYSIARRLAVSGECSDDAALAAFVPPVHAKEPGLRERLDVALGKNTLFSSIDPEVKTVIFDAMFERSFQAGDVIIHQGEEGDNFYVVEVGILDISVKKDGEEVPKKVKTVGPGGSFGELALMYDTPRAATVTAVTDGVLWGLDRMTYKSVLLKSVKSKREMYESFLSQVPILSTLCAYERSTIADALSSDIYEAGTDIVREGEHGDHFYIILEGDVVVTRKEFGEVGRLKKADFFGEIAMLSKSCRRAATVTAVGRVKAAHLDRPAFERLLGPLEDLLSRNLEAYQKYVQSSV